MGVHRDHHFAGTVTSVATHKLNVGQKVEAWKASIQRGKNSPHSLLPPLLFLKSLKKVMKLLTILLKLLIWLLTMKVMQACHMSGPQLRLKVIWSILSSMILAHLVIFHHLKKISLLTGILLHVL